MGLVIALGIVLVAWTVFSLGVAGLCRAAARGDAADRGTKRLTTRRSVFFARRATCEPRHTRARLPTD